VISTAKNAKKRNNTNALSAILVIMLIRETILNARNALTRIVQNASWKISVASVIKEQSIRKINVHVKKISTTIK
jgi:hypothetical protein